MNFTESDCDFNSPYIYFRLLGFYSLHMFFSILKESQTIILEIFYEVGIANVYDPDKINHYY